MRNIIAVWISLCLIMLTPQIANADLVTNDAAALHILYYDNIEFEEDPYQFLNGLPLADFEKHLKFFKDESYQVIDLNNTTQIQNLKGTNNVSLLFNGEDAEAIALAIPLLKKYGYRAHITMRAPNTAYRKPKNNIFKRPYLNIKFSGEHADFTQKIVNDDTSRFREIFGFTPDSVLLNNVELYMQHKDMFDLYDFNQIFVPTNEANMIDPFKVMRSYIAVQPSFSNLDILRTYLNRRPFPYQNMSMTKHDDKDSRTTKISWGITLFPESDINLKLMNCVSSNGKTADIFPLDKRAEIRYSKAQSSDAVKMHCTAPILDKNSNKTEAYRYMMLHEPLL